MKIHAFIILIIFASTILVFGKVINAHKRRNILTKSGRVFSIAEAGKNAAKFRKIVQTDFGFGKEYWALTNDKNEIDLNLRVFKSGILILPRPKLSDMRVFCQSSGIPLQLMMIK